MSLQSLISENNFSSSGDCSDAIFSVFEKKPPRINHGFYLEQANTADSSILNIKRQDIFRKLASHGAVLFRGFCVNINVFSSIVELTTPKTAIDPARSFFAKNVQLVDSGTDAIGLHCENGTTPLVPDVVWFYCERAASIGSQTTLCDGIEVWKHLSAQTQEMFLSKKVRFSRNVKSDLWTKYVKHHFPELVNETQINQKMLDKVFGHIVGSDVRLNPDGSLFLSHAAFAAHPTSFSEVVAFANSLFTPSFNYEAPTVCFEDGKPIPEWLLQESRSQMKILTTEIPWKSGDVIMIDNSRVMHGRRRIEDTTRKIFTSLGFLPPEDKALVVDSENNGGINI